MESHANLNTTTFGFDRSPNFGNAGITLAYYLNSEYKGQIENDKTVLNLTDLSLNTIYTIVFETVYNDTANRYYTNETFYTINPDISIYNLSTLLSAVRVTGNTATLYIAKSGYYTTHVINYSTIFGPASVQSTGVWPYDTYTLLNLERDTSYNLTVTSYIEDIAYSHPAIISIRTLDEGVVDISNIAISNTSATIQWKNTASSNLNHIIINNANVTNFSYVFNTLKINTNYDFSFVSVFNTKNEYVSNVSFMTLNEQNPTYSIETYFTQDTRANSYIDIQNTNQADVSGTIINIQEGSYLTTSYNFETTRYSMYSGNIVTTYNPHPPNGNKTYIQNIYTTDFSFNAIMYKPLYQVGLDNIHISWFDISSGNIPYDIKISRLTPSLSQQVLGTSHDIKATDTSYNITTDLSQNEIYDISFTRHFPNGILITEFQRIKTLKQVDPSETNNMIIQNSGLQSSNVVFDLSYIVQRDDYLYNEIKLFITNTPDSSANDIFYTSNNALFDVSVNLNNFYYFRIQTDSTSHSLNVLYEQMTTAYTPFIVNVTNINESVIKNGGFSFLYPEKLSYSNGVARTLPYEWSGVNAIVSQNIYNLAYNSTKFLNVDDVSNNVMLFYNSVSVPGQLSQSFPYLFKGYYNLMFNVATHVIKDHAFGHYFADETIDYKLSVMPSVYESATMVSTEVDWRRFGIKLYIPYSLRDVTVKFSRQMYEFNNLFLTNISMVSYTPTTVVSRVFSENDWILPGSGDVSKWDDPSGNNFLATNMSVGFWLYIHNNITMDNLTKKYIFVLGSSTESGNPSIYIQQNSIGIGRETWSHQMNTSVVTKIPIYYNITFYNSSVCIFKNGRFDSSYNTPDYLKEAIPTENIWIGTPSVEVDGYLIKNVSMYDFQLSGSQIEEIYNSFAPAFSEISNSKDISGNCVIIDLSANFYLHNNDMDISFDLFNERAINRSINLYGLQDTRFNLNSGLSFTSCFSIAFWGNNLIGNIYFQDSASQKSILTITGNNAHIFTNIDESSKLPNTEYMQHYSWTFGSNGRSSYLNGYLYDHSMNSNLPDDFSYSDISEIRTTCTGIIGELKLFNTSLTPKEVLSTYYNYYNLNSSYDLSGVYRVTLGVPAGCLSDISFAISGNLYNLNRSLTGYFSSTMSTVDISMNAFDLNNFNKSDSSFQFKLPNTNNIFTHIRGNSINHPYIDASTSYVGTTTSISENAIVQITLKHAPASSSYQYTIGGNVDLSDIVVTDASYIQNLNGFIQGDQPIYLKMREDLKTEGLEKMVFSIVNLGLAVNLDISDTVISLLTSPDQDNNKLKDESFIVSLSFPENYFNFNDASDISYDIVGVTMPTDVSASSPNFHRDISYNKTKIDILFSVLTSEKKTFTMTLPGYDSQIDIRLNDIPSPVLSLDPSNGSVEEGGVLKFTLKTPQDKKLFSKNAQIWYTTEFTDNSELFSDVSGTNYNSNTNTGFFIMGDDFTSDISFIIIKTYIVPIKIMKLILTSHTDISASIYIINDGNPPSYLWNFSDIYENAITQINEGSMFNVWLSTSGVDPGSTIYYNIHGMNSIDFVSDATYSNVLNGSFTINDSGSSTKRSMKIINNKSSDGDRNMIFATAFNDANLLDVSSGILVNDTSQSPIYTIGSTISRPTIGQLFKIVFSIQNYSFLTEQQTSQQFRYVASVSPPSTYVECIEGIRSDIIVLNAGTIESVPGSSIRRMTHSFSYRCKTSQPVLFTFTIAGKKFDISMNP